MFRNPAKDLENALFTMKFTSKQLERQAGKTEKEKDKNEGLLKKAIETGNTERARVYAENSIRKRQEALNLLRLSSRLDACGARIQTAIVMRQITKSMGTTVKGLEGAMKAMDLAKMAKIMDQFEVGFDNVDVQTGVMESSMSGATSMSTPQDQVDALITKVGEEHNLDVKAVLGTTSVVGTSMPAISADEEARLTERLKALRDMD